MSHGDPSKLLYAKRLAAAMAYIALANLDAYDRAATARASSACPRPGRSSGGRLLEFVDAIEAQGTTDLAEGLKQFSCATTRRE